MYKMTTKQPVAPNLRQMQVGEEQTFPIERLVTVRVTVGRLHQLCRRKGVRYTVRTAGLNVYVKRIA